MVCVHWHREMCAYIVCLSNGIDVCIEKHCALCMMCLLKSLRCNVLYIYIYVCVCVHGALVIECLSKGIHVCIEK